jgi:soluble lytic murein transglycosylase
MPARTFLAILLWSWTTSVALAEPPTPGEKPAAPSGPALFDQGLKRPAPWDKLAPRIAGKKEVREKALAEIRALLAAKPKIDKKTKKLINPLSAEDRRRLTLVLAVTAYKANRYDDVLALLSGVDDWPLMEPYLHYLRGGSLFHTGHFAEALAPLSAVTDCGVAVKALDQLLAAQYALGRWDDLRASLERHRDGALKGTPELLFYDAALASRTPGADATEPLTKLRLLVMSFPTHELAARAVGLLPQGIFSDQFPKDLAAFTRAQRALDSGHNEGAASGFRSFLAGHKPDHPLYCAARGRLVKALYGKRAYAEAAPQVRASVPECEADPATADVLFYGGRILWRHGDVGGALAAYRALRERFPQHSYRDDAILYEALIHKDGGEPERYLATLEEAVRLYPQDDRRAEILWWLAWHHYRAGHSREALDWFIRGYDESRQPAFLYWQARVLDGDPGMWEQAQKLYVDLLRDHPMDYYALLGYARLAARLGASKAATLAGSETRAAAKAHAPLVGDEELREELARPRYQRFLELMTVGLESWALDEYPGAQGGDAAWWLKARILASAGRQDLSHQVVRRKLKALRGVPPLRSFRPYWDLGYPSPFAGLSERQATRAGIATEFVEAITREESGFLPEVVSYADAHGLMQLIPSTGKLVARSNGLRVPSAADLHSPSTNLMLGALYLDYLARRFGSPLLASGGYNAGHAAMDRWVKKWPQRFELDEFVEEIPYQQAREYVKHVVESYGIYRFLHSEGKRRLLLDLNYDTARRYKPDASLTKWKPAPRKPAAPPKKAAPAPRNAPAKKKAAKGH